MVLQENATLAKVLPTEPMLLLLIFITTTWYSTCQVTEARTIVLAVSHQRRIVDVSQP